MVLDVTDTAADDDSYNQEVRRLESAGYLSLATLKKSGDYVNTPVWFAPANGNYYIFSAPDVGKLKRLRNFSQCRVAACTATGTVTGKWLDATAELLELQADKETALASLRQKYGWQMKLTDCLSKMTGKLKHRAYIRVQLQPLQVRDA
jgi:PPOX class probable F420-dependent enzyme